MSDKFQNKYRIPSARASWWDYGRNAPYFITICTQDKECYFGDIGNPCDGLVETLHATSLQPERLTSPKKQFIASPIGEIAQTCWLEIPQHFPFVQLDSFVVMPNHIHGIIIIDKTDRMVDENEIKSGINDLDINKTIENPIVESIENSDNDLVETLHATSLPQSHATFLPDPGTTFQPHATFLHIKNEHMASISPKWGTLGSIVRSYKSAVSKKAHKINPGFAWQERFYDTIILKEESYQNIYDYIINNPANWEKDKFYIE